MRGALLVLLTIVSVACAAVTFPSKRNKRDQTGYHHSEKRVNDYWDNLDRIEREEGDGQATNLQAAPQKRTMSSEMNEQIIEEQKRRAVLPLEVRGKKKKRNMAAQIGKQAVEKQLEIMGEQQQKAAEFVDKKLDINIVPDKGWKTEDLFVPSGFHIDAEITGEDAKQEGEKGEQPFMFPMGVGGMIMNGCFGKNYQPGDPCYQATWKTTICLNLIDGATFIGVGFDGRGDFSSESRKMSIVQRSCKGRATYDDLDVPDTMNVHGVYDTSATMQSFYSRTEYQTFLQRQAGMAGSAFGFYAGVKKAWGSSTLSGGQQYLALFSIDIDRYEIYLDEVKPDDLSVNFLQEFMELPLSYLAPGAAIKFQDFILRWGTHYIKSGKFGGRLQIFKSMEANQVASKAEFSQVMEAEFRSLFASFHAKSENKGGSSQKQQSKTSSTSITVEGGDQEIAAIISDENSPTIKNEIKQWLESIRTFPKPFKFMVAPITDLLKFNPLSLFADEERDWGCEAHPADMKKDPDTGESYYEVKINGTLAKKMCPYKDRDDLIYVIERRRDSLERAVGIYMEEGPISVSDITLPAGRPGCQTENFKFQAKAGKPSWDAIIKDETIFLVVFSSNVHLVGSFKGPVAITPRMERYVRYFNGEWFASTNHDDIDMTSSCSYGGENNKICILGLVLTYNPRNGYLSLTNEDLDASKEAFQDLAPAKVGTIMAHAEWPAKNIFQMDTVVGYLPCNVKWSNALRFDPSNKEGKCLHFTASSKGTVFVIFAAVPEMKNTWYYVQISSAGVGIFKSQKLMVSTVDVNAVGLGSDILYQSYFVCVKETRASTVIEYGKSQGTTEFGDVYLAMIDRDNPSSVRFYSFGNGEKPLEVIDAHIISRHLTKANCRGDTVLDKEMNMCVQNCHELCDPNQGCRRTSKGKPLATDCNACRYVKKADTGECLEKCPEGWEKNEDICVKSEQEMEACDSDPCFNGGYCTNEAEGKYSCQCQSGWFGERCETVLGYDLLFPKKGTSDYVIINNLMPSLTAVTICLWMKVTDTGNKGTPLSYAVPGSDNELVLYNYNGFSFEVASTSRQTSVSANDGKWHHICATWENTAGSWKLFKDGKLGASGTDFKTGHVISGGGALVLAQEQDSLGGKFGDTQNFIGEMTGVNIWDHVITDQEIMRMSQSCQTGVGNVFKWSDFKDHVKGSVKIIENNCLRVEAYGAMEACDSDPCLNGGHCTNEAEGKYSCQCQSGWFGERCETGYDLLFPRKGTSDYVIINNAMPSLTALTICLWMKVTDTGNKGTPLSYAVPGSDNELVLFNYNGFSFEVASTSRQTSVSANDGKWHHICATWENTAGSWKLFKDGKLGASGTGFKTGHVIPGGGALVLAQEQDSLGGKFGDTQNFIGEMTGVNIWDHVITDQDIMRMSQSCQTGVGNVFNWSDFKDHVKGSVKIIENNCHRVEADGGYDLLFPKKGTSDYVIINNAMPSLTALTICLWMKVTDTGNKGTPLSYAVPGSYNELILFNYNAFSFEVAGSSRQTSVSANDGKWHHICATWDNTAGSWKLFKDGKLGDSGTDFKTGHVIPGGGALVLAQEQDSLGGKFGDTQNFIGEMTGVNIWDHVITDQEIMRMSQSCQTGVGNVFKWSDFKDHVKGSVKIIESSC
ncbi:hypothetical protein ACROYT_G007668 [Oculina patagonica]